MVRYFQILSAAGTAVRISVQGRYPKRQITSLGVTARHTIAPWVIYYNISILPMKTETKKQGLFVAWIRGCPAQGRSKGGLAAHFICRQLPPSGSAPATETHITWAHAWPGLWCQGGVEGKGLAVSPWPLQPGLANILTPELPVRLAKTFRGRSYFPPLCPTLFPSSFSQTLISDNHSPKCISASASENPTSSAAWNHRASDWWGWTSTHT